MSSFKRLRKCSSVVSTVCSAVLVLALNANSTVYAGEASADKSATKISPPTAIQIGTGKAKLNLNDFLDKKAVVVVAHGVGCPVMKQNYPSFLELEKEFEKSGIAFVFVNGNTHDSSEAIAKEAKDFGVEDRIGRDKDQIWLRSFGLKTIGEAAVVVPQKSDWQIVFRGGISDRVNFDRALGKAKNEYLKTALQEIVAGKLVTTQRAPVFGCAITLIQDENKR